MRMSLVILVIAAGSAARAEDSVPPGEMAVPENKWVKVAEVPADPLGRELEPGRGAFWCFEPTGGVLLRYGGYTPTDCNALWTFDLAKRKWENPLKVDYAWPPPVDRPGAGAWWSTAWDAKRKVVWLCGGSGVAARKQAALFNDVWQYDPAKKAFAAMKSKGFPAFSAGCRIAYDSKNDLLVRAPAYDGEWGAMCNRDTTWVYDPNKNAWDGRKTPGGPKNALATAFVFDPASGKCVYFKPAGDSGPGETWTFDAAGSKWEKLASQENPPGAVVPGACYDPDNKLVVLYGGVGGAKGGYGYLHRGGGVQLHETWALDVGKGQWKKLDVGAPVVPKLPGERGPRFELVCAMDYDAKSKAVVLTASTVGVWALCYRPEGAAALGELKLAALPAPEKIEPPKEPVFKLAEPNKKLLDLEENKWTQLEGGPSVGGGEVPMTYDEATGYCLKFGGCNNGGAGTFSSGYGNDLSAYDPANERWLALRWVDPCGPPRPANGCTRFYAYDPVRKVTWFAGGTSGNHLAASLPPGVAGGTWSYDGLRDRFELVPSTGKQPPPGTICCYDRANNLFVADPKEAWAQANVFHFDPAKKAWTLGAGIKGYPYTFGCYVDSLKSLVAVKAEGKDAPRTMLYDAAAAAWRDAAPKGDGPYGPGRQTLACDPDNDVVLCVLEGKSYIYNVKENSWKVQETNTPKVCEEMVFDRRHKVFLASAAMGCPMWAYRWRKVK
jgi:hypothetical protein